MATIPTVPDEKDTTKASTIQSIVEAFSELSAEVGSTSSLKNGSFEDVISGEPALWVVTDESGGSHAISDATESGGEAHHGKRSLQITTTGLGGFAEALSDLFLPVGSLNTVLVEGFTKRDTASIRIRIQVLYYNVNLSLVATDTITDITGVGGTGAYGKSIGTSDVPVGAHYFKIKLIGGEVGNTISGNVFFDGFMATLLLNPLGITIYPTAGSHTYTVPDGIKVVHITVAGAGGGGGGSLGGAGGGGGGAGFIEGITVNVEPGDTFTAAVTAGGAGGVGNVDGADGVGIAWAGPDFLNRWVQAGPGLGGKSQANGGGGGSGWNSGLAYSAPNGGNGADHAFGNPGAGGTTGDGEDALFNCTGGGGSGSTGFNGGAGADGYIIVVPQLT